MLTRATQGRMGARRVAEFVAVLVAVFVGARFGAPAVARFSAVVVANKEI